jgi:2-oxoglutarate dehydrogenase E1 component
MFNNDNLDWSMAEHLAYGSLLEEGFNVRISGQDVERGTFSHRHSVVKVEESEEEIILHNNISESQGTFSIYNSLLSEYGVLGFEYGYAMSSPNTLTIWEAQFGDFGNGAQIIIDQYIFSGEDKWKTSNGIVLLLPHGYEGQGSEHSSARVERYLQLCAKDNVFVANCTTPANMYHLLRRQMKTNYRKPLIVFTPKSLLRHSRVFSSVDEFTKGGFQVVIDDTNADPKTIDSIVFVTGKFYYDLLEEKERLGRNNLAIVRIEQLFPLPKEVIRSIIKKYSNASDIVWAQEEPRNMGAYGFLLMNLKEAKDFRIASRRNYGATAAGSFIRFEKRHREVIEYVFNPEKDNQILK